DYAGITEGGHYFFTGDTDGATTTDEFIFLDGNMLYREGMMLDGEVLSYTCLRHPAIPGYPKDPICAVIRLGEGTNIVSNLVGCEYEDVSIGMKVKGVVEQVDDKTILPQFYPV
ncbi:MAG: OB-fold domain-containing protein, partial [Thiohalobacterales bacterium]|nr:OB-fold domain-containing protein [Thiohalobacterales bacterium]